MADGGDFAYVDPALDDKLDNDEEEEEEEVNRTQPFNPQPFRPGAASTPRYQESEMQTMQNEQSGLPDTSYEETPMLGTQSERQNSWDALARLFPRAKATNLETSYSKTGRLQVQMFGAGKKNLQPVH